MREQGPVLVNGADSALIRGSPIGIFALKHHAAIKLNPTCVRTERTGDAIQESRLSST